MKILFASILTLLVNNSALSNQDKPLVIGFGAGNQPYVALENQMIHAEGHENHHGIEYSIVRQAVLLMNLEIDPKPIPPRELKRSIKKFKNIDMVSGVTRSIKDKLYYSRPILEKSFIAVSKANLTTKINSISNLSGFNVIARTGSYATIKDGYSKLYHPKKGTHKHKYKEYDKNLELHAEFWRPGSEKVLITTKEGFKHFRMLLASIYDTNEEVVINEIFPTKTRLYVAFKDKKLKKEFNEALEELKFEGTYARIFKHYDHEESPDFRKPNRMEIIRQLKF